MCVLTNSREGGTQQYIVFLGSGISDFRKRGSSYTSLEAHGRQRASDESVSVLGRQEIIFIFHDISNCVWCWSMLKGKEFSQDSPSCHCVLNADSPELPSCVMNLLGDRVLNIFPLINMHVSLLMYNF